MKLLYTPLLLLAGALTSLTAVAQPALDERYYMRVGNSFNMTLVEDTGSFPTVTTGSNHAWDFSSVGPGQLMGGSVLLPSQGPSAALFPTSNALMRFNSGPFSSDIFVSNSAQGSSVVGQSTSGFGAPASIAIYSLPGAPILKAGLGFGLSDTTVYTQKSYTSGQTDTTYNQIREIVTYLGYGSLTVPFGGSYTDVIHLRTLTWTYESGTPAGPFTLSDSTTRDTWYAPGIGYPVAEFERGFILSNGVWGPDYYGFMMTNAVVGARPRLETALATISPNPARDWAQLNLPAGETAHTATLTDAAGRSIATRAISEGRISLAGLEPGLYWVEVQGQKTYRARVVKE